MITKWTELVRERVDRRQRPFAPSTSRNEPAMTGNYTIWTVVGVLLIIVLVAVILGYR